MNTIEQNNNEPLVSVIVPAYNAEKYIEKTLNSVLSQTYNNIEVIVVDDGSQDKTSDIIESIAQKDQRVLLLRQSNSGVAIARNLAIQHSRGEFIAPIDADDIWYPQNIEKQLQCIKQAGSNVGLVYAWSIDINEEDIPTGKFRAFTIQGEVYSTLLCHDFIGNASSSLIRKDCFNQVGGYKPQIYQQQIVQGCEDWELYLCIAEYYQFRVVPEFLIGYRKLTRSMSSNCNGMANFRELVWQSVYQKYPKTPAIIYRLSNASFYMFLARQSDKCGKHKDTLFWLYKALQLDFLTPWLRLGLYSLISKSFLKITFQPLTSLVWTDHQDWVDFQAKFHRNKNSSAFDTKPTILKVKFQNLIGQFLHKLINIVFGDYHNWVKP